MMMRGGPVGPDRPGSRGRRPDPVAPSGAVPPGRSCVSRALPGGTGGGPGARRPFPARCLPVRDPRRDRGNGRADTGGTCGFRPGGSDPRRPADRRRSRLPDGTARCGSRRRSVEAVHVVRGSRPGGGGRAPSGGTRGRPSLGQGVQVRTEAAVRSPGGSRAAGHGAFVAVRGDGVQRLAAAGASVRSTGFRPPRWETVGRICPGRTPDASRGPGPARHRSAGCRESRR
jgi:hypothetical protein